MTSDEIKAQIGLMVDAWDQTTSHPRTTANCLLDMFAFLSCVIQGGEDPVFDFLGDMDLDAGQEWLDKGRWRYYLSPVTV